jgi:membrane fusion protein, multidrug efflux system
MMGRATISILILLCLSCDRQRPDAVPAQQQENSITVSVHEVQSTQMELSPELFGRVRPVRMAEIRPQVSGVVLQRMFQEGSLVNEGDQLYQIDPARFQASLELAEAKLAQARAGLFSAQSLFGRYEQLIKINAVSRQELDDAQAGLRRARADVKAAEAEISQARIDLEYTKVFAPITGYIGTSAVTEGALVTANQASPLAVIRVLNPVYVDLTVSSSEAARLRQDSGRHPGTGEEELKVTIRPEHAGELHPHKGVVEARELAVDELSGSLNLRVVVPNPELLLLPGMFVRGLVEGMGERDVLLVPQKAVDRDRNGEAHVWLIHQDQSVERRRIVISLMRGQDWLVDEGLKAGDRIALDNLARLTSGATIEVAEESE